MIAHAGSNEHIPEKKAVYVEQEKKFEGLLTTAKASYHEKLWAGKQYSLYPFRLKIFNNVFLVLKRCRLQV